VAVEPVRTGDTVTALRVVSRSESGRESARQTRGLVVAVGGSPHVPELFKRLEYDPRMLHSSRYLDLIGERGLERPDSRVAVIGGGQSAAEITVDLQSRFPEARIDLIFRGHSLKPSDSSPFVNEIFHPSYTDFMYDLAEQDRQAVVRTFRNTNYAVVDPDLLETLHKILYQQKVEGRSQVGLMPRSQINAVTASYQGITVSTEDRFAEASKQTTYDAVILATGYERSLLHPFLEPIARDVEELSVDRDYRLKMREGFLPRIHLQGYSETSHGLSDTLLSVLAIRSQEIAKSISTMSWERAI
jgi:L-ornithine N5-oxygenase